MKKLITRLVFVLIPMFVSSVATATEAEKSHMDISKYPSHTCSAPTRPVEPGSLNTQSEVDKYNAKVDNYNSKIVKYTDCIQKYVDVAKNDIKKIRKKITDAIKEANSQ